MGNVSLQKHEISIFAFLTILQKLRNRMLHLILDKTFICGHSELVKADRFHWKCCFVKIFHYSDQIWRWIKKNGMLTPVWIKVKYKFKIIINDNSYILIKWVGMYENAMKKSHLGTKGNFALSMWQNETVYRVQEARLLNFKRK